MKPDGQKNEGQGEQKLADIFENAGIGIYRTTPDGRILMANPAMVRMLEFSSFEELSRRNLENKGFGPCYPRFVFKQCMEEEGRVSGLESEWVTRNGARLVVIENARVVRDGNGQILYYEGTATDITRLKRLEEELHERERLYRSAAEDSPALICHFLPKGEITFINAAYCEFLGKACEELVGSNVASLIPEQERQAVLNGISSLTVDSPSITNERRIITADGQVCWQRWTYRAFFDEYGHAVSFQAFGEDITEQKIAEEAASRNLALIHGILDNAGSVIVVRDAQGRYVLINREAEKVLGSKSEEIIGKTPYDIHSKDKAAKIMADDKEVLASCKPLHIEDQLVVNGETRIFIGTRFPLLDSAGRPYAVCTLATDMTERKKAEDALRESEQKLRAVFDNLVDGVLLVDLESRKFYMANNMICEMLGYGPEELQCLGPADIHPEKDLPYAMEKFEKVIRRELKIADDLPIKRKDGSVFYADINTFPIKIEMKEYFAGVFRDVTDRKLSEESLRESEEKYRTLVESAGESIASINKDGMFLFMNEVGAERLGGKPDDFVGKTMWDIFPGDVADRQMGSVIKVIETGESMNVVVPTILQGQMRWYNTTIGPLRDHSGKIVAVMVVARDVHELKKAEEELSKYREQMSRAEQLASLGTLSATIAHQITQPLTVIRLCLENALDELEGTSCSKAVTTRLSESIGQVSNITSIVNNFRNFARRSSDTWIGLVSVWAVAERLTSLMSETARQARVRFVLENLDGLAPVMLRERELEQLFFALIENSIQAADGKESRQIVITGSMKGKHLELRFCDNCGGISPQNIGKVFEPFFTTKPPGQSTGLGLCIAQDVVTRAGGSILVESEFGVGATFVVTLPASETMAKPQGD